MLFNKGHVKSQGVSVNERIGVILLLESDHRHAVIVLPEPQIRQSVQGFGDHFRGILIICGVNRVKFFLVTHFQMWKYISIPHTCNVTVKRNRINWRRIQTGRLPTESKGGA